MTETTEKLLTELLKAGNEVAAYNAIIDTQDRRLQTFIYAEMPEQQEVTRQILERLQTLRSEMESEVSCLLAGIEQECLEDFTRG